MIELTIITVLILLNGVFVAAEFAIVGAPRAAIDARAAQGDRLARLVQRVLRDTQTQDRYIATAQLGITLASLGLGMYGEHVLADAIYHYLDLSGAPAWIISHGFASVLAVAILTYFHIVVGEMVPKSLALQQAERLACWITPPMLWTKNLLYPFVVTLNGLGNLVLKGIGVNRQAQNADQVLHAGGVAADRSGERRAGRAALGVERDAPGALRVRRPHRRTGDGPEGPHRGNPGGHAAGRDSRAARRARAYPISHLREGSRSHPWHGPHQGSPAPAPSRGDDHRGSRAGGAGRAGDRAARHRAGDDAPRANRRWRWSSTSTAAPPAWSRSRIFSRKWWARSKRAP